MVLSLLGERGQRVSLTDVYLIHQFYQVCTQRQIKTRAEKGRSDHDRWNDFVESNVVRVELLLQASGQTTAQYYQWETQYVPVPWSELGGEKIASHF